MKSQPLKLTGLLIIIMVFTFMLAGCDMANNGNEVNKEPDPHGMIITVNVPEGLAGEQGDVGVLTIEKNITAGKVRVTLEGKETEEVVTEEIEVADAISDKYEVTFDDVAADNYEIEAELIGYIREDTEDSKTLYEGEGSAAVGPDEIVETSVKVYPLDAVSLEVTLLDPNNSGILNELNKVLLKHPSEDDDEIELENGYDGSITFERDDGYKASRWHLELEFDEHDWGAPVEILLLPTEEKEITLDVGLVTASIEAEDTTATAGELGEIKVTAYDSKGNPVPGETIKVSDDGGLSGLSEGDTSNTNHDGVATFSFTEDTAGEYIVEFSVEDDEDITDTATVTVETGDADSVEVKTQPTDTVAGEVIVGPPEAEVTDAGGNPVEGVEVSVRASIVDDGEYDIENDSEEGALTEETGSDGIATFDDLVIKTSGSFQLIFDAVGVEDATSNVFDVIAGDTNSIEALDVTVEPEESEEITVFAIDEFDNPVPDETIKIDSIIKDEEEDSLGDLDVGETETTDDEGVARFSFTEETAGEYTVEFSVKDDKDINDTATVTVEEIDEDVFTEINNWDDLANMTLDGDYKLKADLDSTTNDYDDNASEDAHEGKGWEPIGTDSEKFTGAFDGNGHTIEDLVIDRPEENNVGLFGHVGDENAATTIKNVCVDANVTGGRGTGVLIGRVTGNSNTLIEQCCATGTVTGTGATGGLIGSFNSHRDTPGGIDNPILSESFADVEVTDRNGGDKFGGIAGCSQKGTIINSYAHGNVTISENAERVGGLAGCIDLRGELNKSYSIGKVTAEDSDNVGGLVGNLSGPGGNEGKVFYSYWDTETSEQDESAGGEGKTTTEMQEGTADSEDIYENWDDNIWNYGTTYYYPKLDWENNGNQ